MDQSRLSCSLSESECDSPPPAKRSASTATVCIRCGIKPIARDRCNVLAVCLTCDQHMWWLEQSREALKFFDKCNATESFIRQHLLSADMTKQTLQSTRLDDATASESIEEDSFISGSCSCDRASDISSSNTGDELQNIHQHDWSSGLPFAKKVRWTTANIAFDYAQSALKCIKSAANVVQSVPRATARCSECLCSTCCADCSTSARKECVCGYADAQSCPSKENHCCQINSRDRQRQSDTLISNVDRGLKSINKRSRQLLAACSAFACPRNS